MNTSEKQESAKLILQLYDLRREEKMRESRAWWWSFNPTSVDDFHKALASPDSAKLRQSMGYWEMAAALVNHGAIDEAMFFDTNGEYLFMYVKCRPFLEEGRKMDPRLMINVEKMIMRMPNAEQTLEHVRQMVEQWSKK